jgi:hypothetical protein
MRETIRVFPAENGMMRADHVMTFFGAVFLRLHYRMRLKPNEVDKSLHSAEAASSVFS